MANFCRKCGAEIPEGARFCAKCGNPIGDTQKRQTGKKSSVIGIGAGAVLLIAAVVSVLCVTGVIGGEKEAVPTSADMESVQESQPIAEVTESQEPQPVAEVTESQEPQPPAEITESQGSHAVADREAMMLEAYEAYKKYVDDENGLDRDYYDIMKIGGSYESFEDFRTAGGNVKVLEYSYAMIYLDADDCPEMAVSCYRDSVSSCHVFLYAYQNGTVSLKTGSYSGCFNTYKEKQGYVHAYPLDFGGTEPERIGYYDGNTIEEVINYCDNSNTDGKRYINDKEVTKAEYKKQIEKNYGNETDWKQIENEESIDEAYINLQKSASSSETQ